ncbi:hypothetical protein H8959_011229 [Pygathrix nigripes]
MENGKLIKTAQGVAITITEEHRKELGNHLVGLGMQALAKEISKVQGIKSFFHPKKTTTALLTASQIVSVVLLQGVGQKNWMNVGIPYIPVTILMKSGSSILMIKVDNITTVQTDLGRNGNCQSIMLHPKQQREIIKSRSLDRRLQEPIVLTKWRHSTIVLDTNDKESPTASKPCFPENESSPSSPKHQDTDQEKYGLLNVTKIAENGKKVRKNWLSSWAVLQGSSLLFTKTQGSSTSWFGSNQSKPEFTVDLKGATIEMASKDKSSKKNVFELKTRQGTELLIQSDSDTVINDWFKVLSSTINNQAVDTDEGIEEEILPDSPGIEKHDKEKEQKDPKKLRSFKVSSIDSSEQKKTKKNLKKFLTRRPTLQAVREKGYIKDQVFGSNLANLCQRENGTVPKFVKLCIEHVEEHGLDVDGIYRVSGNLAVIQKLRFAVNHDEKLDLNDSKWEDIHVITGALKMFFRELPEPLFTFNHFNDFVNAIKQEPRQRVAAVKDLIRQLPKPNQDTMQILFRHLRRVVENGEKNRMTYQSIAIVFGPTLLKPEKETGNIAVHTVYQNQIVELILLELSSIFGR